MTILVVTVADQTFDKKSSEVAYLRRVLELVGAELERTRGTISTTVTVRGVKPDGTPNTAVATYAYTASASNA